MDRNIQNIFRNFNNQMLSIISVLVAYYIENTDIWNSFQLTVFSDRRFLMYFKV